MTGITHMRVVTQKLDIKAEKKRMYTIGTNINHDSMMASVAMDTMTTALN